MAGTGSSNTHDVMISYSWGSQKTVLKIRDKLEENGVTCRKTCQDQSWKQ